jgi:hypothetical protein
MKKLGQFSQSFIDDCVGTLIGAHKDIIKGFDGSLILIGQFISKALKFTRK